MTNPKRYKCRGSHRFGSSIRGRTAYQCPKTARHRQGPGVHLASCDWIPDTAMKRSGHAMRASTEPFSWRFHPPASTAGRFVPRACRARIVVPFTATPPPRKAQAIARVCAAARNSRAEAAGERDIRHAQPACADSITCSARVMDSIQRACAAMDRSAHPRVPSCSSSRFVHRWHGRI